MPSDIANPAITWNGSEFGLVWEDAAGPVRVIRSVRHSDAVASWVSDGVVLFFDSAVRVEWNPETGPDAWNRYSGDLGELRAGGAYTQEPGTKPLADRVCGVETSLGTDSTGEERPNAAPCW